MVDMSRKGRDARLGMVARRQAGAFTFDQALKAGYPRSTVSRRLSAGVWRRLRAGVYVAASDPPSRDQDLWAAVLGVGRDVAVTHESAALLHGAERLPEEPITLTNPHRWHHHLTGVLVHQIDDLAPDEVTRIQGLPVSKAARTVVDLGAVRGIGEVGRVADDLVRLRRTSYASINAALLRVARPGKPGIVTVGRMLDERGDGHVPPASELERALFATIDAGGLPAPGRQISLPGRNISGIKGIADGGYLDAMVILEADGRRWHSRLAAARADRERDAQAARAGWLTLRFVYEQIVDEPEEVCAVIADVRAQRLAQLGRRAA